MRGQEEKLVDALSSTRTNRSKMTEEATENKEQGELLLIKRHYKQYETLKGVLADKFKYDGSISIYIKELYLKKVSQAVTEYLSHLQPAELADLLDKEERIIREAAAREQAKLNGKR